MTDNDYMQMALNEAQKAFEAGEVPVGCIIVAQNRVVGRGHNLTQTLSDVTAHAEMQAITAASQALGGKYLNECTLYVTVEPCVMCAGAIGWAQLKRLVYGTKDPKRGYSLLSPDALHPKTEVATGVLEADCQQLMETFFKQLR